MTYVLYTYICTYGVWRHFFILDWITTKQYLLENVGNVHRCAPPLRPVRPPAVERGSGSAVVRSFRLPHGFRMRLCHQKQQSQSQRKSSNSKHGNNGKTLVMAHLAQRCSVTALNSRISIQESAQHTWAPFLKIMIQRPRKGSNFGMISAKFEDPWATLSRTYGI